jgi:glycyl-tRNA synthetase beta chain
MPELLLELFSEEIPARMQDRAAEALSSLVIAELQNSGLQGSQVWAYATPRRLVLAIEDLPARQPDRQVERRGPKVDAPKQARDGFLASLGGSEYRLEEREEKKGRIVYALIEERGRTTPELLAEALPAILARFPWPKSMRWGSGEARWVRPLHAIVCLFDGAVVPFVFAGVKSGDTTFGHRFMAPGPIQVRDFADYRDKLRSAFVEIKASERRKIIEAKALRLAEERGLRLRPDPGLLDELEGLVEWPVPLIGRIDEASMGLPSEVLTTSMRTHQRYLALERQDGALAPSFITIANTETPDCGATIVSGNEYVLRARLWDARFFWEQDQKRPLESYFVGLDKMVFHAKLGSLREKVDRLLVLAARLVPFVPGADRTLVERAALFAKADLQTAMVGEFPELQGIMGGHYARIQGEPDEVAFGIAEHYAPRGAEECPTRPTSVVVALADKLDTLTGFFAAGLRPTGSKDPFAIRRAAAGIVRLILVNRLRLPLLSALTWAREGFGDKRGLRSDPELCEELRAYLFERFGFEKSALAGLEIAHNGPSAFNPVSVIVAVLSLRDDDLVRFEHRLSAVLRFLAGSDGQSLVRAYRRASNIVGIEEKKDRRRYEGVPDPALLREPAERTLYRALEQARERIEAALMSEDYTEAMTALAALRAPVDEFFDRVMVNADEPELRANRLRLLGLIRSALGRVADFGLIEDVGP